MCFVDLAFDWCSASVPVIIYVISSNIESSYDGTWLYIYHITALLAMQYTMSWGQSGWIILTDWPQGDLNGIFRQEISKLILVIDCRGIPCEIALRWMSLDLTDEKSTLVHSMAWCCQAASHYLNQCWPGSVMPYGVIWPQWVECVILNTLSIFL